MHLQGLQPKETKRAGGSTKTDYFQAGYEQMLTWFLMKNGRGSEIAIFRAGRIEFRGAGAFSTGQCKASQAAFGRICYLPGQGRITCVIIGPMIWLIT